MTDLTDITTSDRAVEIAEYIRLFQPITNRAVADHFGVSSSTISDHTRPFRQAGVINNDDGEYSFPEDTPPDRADDNDGDDDAPPEADSTETPTLETVAQGSDPDPSDLTDREQYIARELQTGTDAETLADELDSRPSVMRQHFRDLKREGWQVYVDETAGQVVIEGDHNLRSSEHTGTRTRKANQWWELRHNALVREFASLQTPNTEQTHADGSEDWILHLTDLHAGDRVRRDDGTVIYETEEVPAVIDYITEQALLLADVHNASYDTGHLLWGGDFLTNEGIYEGQFEDLDAWLDEQHDTLVAPLLRQLKAFGDRFETVNVVCQVGNHGDHRASGTSKQANADLVLYKTVRNVVAELQKETDVLENVSFRIGQAHPYRNFGLRDGALRGHLRHGQHRKPQAETSARKKEWLSTLREHEFDVAWMGHHHIGGRIPWDGPPVITSPSPKPSGEFVERLGESVAGGEQDMATVCGVSDAGLTAVFPIDTRNY